MRSSFKKFCQNIKCVEIGVNAGANALEMLNHLPFAQFILVDSYDVNNSTFQAGGELYTSEQRKAFITNVREVLKPFHNRVQLIIEDSAIANMRFPDNYFDYIYIDAQHEFASVERDLKCWYPKLRVGGIIGGHEAGVGEVNLALTKFFGEGWIIEGEDWYMVKNEMPMWL